MKHEMILEWWDGAEHVSPDTLTCLPQPLATPVTVGVDDSFPDDGTTRGVDQFAAPPRSQSGWGCDD